MLRLLFIASLILSSACFYTSPAWSQGISFKPPKIRVPDLKPPRIRNPIESIQDGIEDIGGAVGDAADVAKDAADTLGQAGKKAFDDTLDESKRFGGLVGREIGKPFRDVDNGTKEAVFFAAKNHVMAENIKRGIRPIRFGPGTAEYEMMQRHMPPGMSFQDIRWFLNGYAPLRMAAITFDNFVYSKEARVAPVVRDSDNDGFEDAAYQAFERYMHLIAHETMHVIQYRNFGGEKEFARKYVTEVLGGFRRYPNIDTVKIHDFSGIEQEANRFERRVIDEWSSRIVGRDQASGFGEIENARPGPKVITLRELVCTKQQERRFSGGDEIFICVTVDGAFYPLNHRDETRFRKVPNTTLKSGERWAINERIQFDHRVEIAVYEMDIPENRDKHDFIGNFHINEEGSGSKRLNGKAGLMKISKHDYTIIWE